MPTQLRAMSMERIQRVGMYSVDGVGLNGCFGPVAMGAGMAAVVAGRACEVNQDWQSCCQSSSAPTQLPFRVSSALPLNLHSTITETIDASV